MDEFNNNQQPQQQYGQPVQQPVQQPQQPPYTQPVQQPEQQLYTQPVQQPEPQPVQQPAQPGYQQSAPGYQQQFYQQRAAQQPQQPPQYNGQYSPYNQPQQNYQSYQYQPPQQPAQGGGLATASMICGIIGAVSVLFCCCCGQWYITLILGVLGLVFGIIAKAKKSPKSGRATAGIILGVVALLAVAVCIVIVLTGGSIFYPLYESMGIDPNELQRLIDSGATPDEISEWIAEQIENSGRLQAVRAFFLK